MTSQISPKIFYICHDNDKPSGGIKTIYNHVQHLVESGFNAVVVVFKSDVEIDWFSSEVPIIHGPKDLHVGPQDWVVMPDDLPAAFETFSKISCHRAIFCQGHYHTFHHLPMEKSWMNYGVEAILASSGEIRKFIRHIFDLDCTLVPIALDQSFLKPEEGARRLQIAYMPRKGHWHIRTVRGTLWHRRPDLRFIRWVPIDNLPQHDVAKVMRESMFFVSTSFREGFGLPPVEAMACGCIVVGFTGGGGKDYATRKNGFWVKDEDALSLAETFENVLDDMVKRPEDPTWESIREEGLKTAQKYNVDNQRNALIDFWSSTLAKQKKCGLAPELSRKNKKPHPNYFEDNLASLGRRFPSIAEIIKKTQLAENIGLEESMDGLPVLKISNGNRKNLYLYDRLNVRHKVNKNLQDFTFRAENATLFSGFGLGYHIEEIQRSMEIDHQVFVIEPCTEIFRLAMESRDLRGLFDDKRIHFFVGKNLEGLHKCLEYNLMHIVAGSLEEMTLAPLKKAFPKEYSQSQDTVQKILLHLRLSYRHYIKNRMLLQNILTNSKYLFEADDIRKYPGLLKRKPAIVVSAGPSLNKNIHLLKGINGKASIISVDAALKPLLDNGVEPDFVVSADPSKLNFKKIDTLSEPTSIPLVFQLGTYHKIPEYFSRTKLVTCSLDAMSKWLFRLVNYGESIGNPTSAAHLAFFLARVMGADPIIFVGLDLSFPDERHHAEGTVLTWAPREDSEYAMVPDVFGGMVKTIPGFQAMIGLFEAEIADTRAMCIDATEGGALILGTEIMDLSTALDKYAANSSIDLERNLKKLTCGPPTSNKRNLFKGLKSLLSETKSIKTMGQDALPLIIRAKEMVEMEEFDKQELSNLFSTIQSFDRHLAENKLFQEVTIDFQAELLIFQYLQGYRIKRAIDKKSSLLFSLESIERAFTDLKQLAEEIIPILEPVLDEIEPIMR